MTQNMGNIDRIIRVIVGLALIAFALLSGNAYAWVGWIGVIPVLTAVVGACPVYSLLGISTCPVRRA